MQCGCSAPPCASCIPTAGDLLGLQTLPDTTTTHANQNHGTTPPLPPPHMRNKTTTTTTSTTTKPPHMRNTTMVWHMCNISEFCTQCCCGWPVFACLFENIMNWPGDGSPAMLAPRPLTLAGPSLSMPRRLEAMCLTVEVGMTSATR